MDRIIDKRDLVTAIDSVFADVREGRTVGIVDDGARVGEIVPSVETLRALQVAAFARSIAIAEERGTRVAGPWKREDLYERVPWRDGPAGCDE